MKLTPAQIAAVRSGEGLRIVDTEVGEEIVVIRADEYDKLRELLDAEQEREAISEAGRRTAARRLSDLPQRRDSKTPDR